MKQSTYISHIKQCKEVWKCTTKISIGSKNIYNYIKTSLISRQLILQMVCKYYEKWNELDEIDAKDKGSITLQQVNALKSQTKPNIQQDSNHQYKDINAKVKGSLEIFELDTFEQCLYKQNKIITFNRHTSTDYKRAESQTKIWCFMFGRNMTSLQCWFSNSINL